MLIAIAIPLIAWAIPGYLLTHYVRHDPFPKKGAPAPLYLRTHYTPDDVTTYWRSLGHEGQLVERRFLEVDLLFPFLYGAGLLGGLLIAWISLGRIFNPAWLVMPVAITMIADWTENLIQWRQLQRFLTDNPVDVPSIQMASAATSTKLAFFVISFLLILVLFAYKRFMLPPQ